MSALFIACADGRVAAALAALQEKEGAPDADRLLVPGGPLVLTRPGMSQTTFMCERDGVAFTCTVILLSGVCAP